MTGTSVGRFSDADLEALRSHRDDPADRVVAQHYEEAERPPGELFRLLALHEAVAETGGDAVARYLAERPPAPSWLDEDTIKRAQGWFVRVWSHAFCALYAGSLPTAYACHQGAQVLHLTARLETNAKRRLNETAQFLLDVMRPGGLDPGGAGFLAARRVRLMHAGVRWLIGHNDQVRWDTASLGEPVNQEDLLLTLLTFTEIVFEVFDRTGVRYSPREAEDYLHLWSYIGILLGVEPHLLPLDRATASELMRHVRRVHFGPSEAGRTLASALLEQAEGSLLPGFKGLPAAAVRWYIGDTTAELIGVPNADWTKALFGPLSALTRILSSTSVHDPFSRAFSDTFGRVMLTIAVDAERGGDRARFAIPEELAGLGVTKGLRGLGRLSSPLTGRR